ncbi:hypothetical protein BC629DRAFT_645979 [Irpex lacteus]|nr:hypothetical protein BC629DRAFT_645979 [Irpex lacteus]
MDGRQGLGPIANVNSATFGVFSRYFHALRRIIERTRLLSSRRHFPHKARRRVVPSSAFENADYMTSCFSRTLELWPSPTLREQRVTRHPDDFAQEGTRCHCPVGILRVWEDCVAQKYGRERTYLSNAPFTNDVDTHGSKLPATHRSTPP